MTDGAEGSLLRFFNVFTKRGDKVVYLNPSFGMYKLYCKMFKLREKPLQVKLDKNFFELIMLKPNSRKRFSIVQIGERGEKFFVGL